MEWFSAENVVAVLTAVLGVFASVGVLWYERRVPRRKRIGYRVQMDTAIGSDVRPGRANVRLGLFNETPDMSDATLVLLRIENDGSQSIADNDYTAHGIHGLTAEFTGRVIRGVAVTQPPDAEHLMEHFEPTAGLEHSGGTLQVPRVPLNPGQHYKLLVLLTGGSVDSPVTVSGGLRDGVVVPNRSVTPDVKPPVFSRPARIITVLFTVCVVTLASLILVRDDHRPPMGCAKGELTLTGSTAFEPVVEELAKKYEKDCPGSDIEVDADGSATGVLELATNASRTVVTLSDGPKTSGFRELVEHQVAMSVFTLVVNDDVTLDGLSTADVRRIYSGAVRDWGEVGGPRGLPVKLISRDKGSGTRSVFESKVLGGDEEAQKVDTVGDCRRPADPAGPVFRCELDTTQQVLNTVSDVPGAIGYSELRSSSGVDGLHRLKLDGHPPSIDTVAESAYPYREIEYAYTYGRPSPDSLASHFLSYMIRGGGVDLVRAQGHLPCGTSEGLEICADTDR